jgi:hypothetical protein
MGIARLIGHERWIDAPGGWTAAIRQQLGLNANAVHVPADRASHRLAIFPLGRIGAVHMLGHRNGAQFGILVNLVRKRNVQKAVELILTDLLALLMLVNPAAKLIRIWRGMIPPGIPFAPGAVPGFRSPVLLLFAGAGCDDRKKDLRLIGERNLGRGGHPKQKSQ